MQWIDEMFANMEKDLTAASGKRGEKRAKADRPKACDRTDPRRSQRVERISYVDYQ